MSTYWYLECTSHDPVLRSDGEISQHTDHWLDVARRLWRERDALRRIEDTIGRYTWMDLGDRYANMARRFILDHHACQLRMVSEYGDVHPIEETNGE